MPKKTYKLFVHCRRNGVTQDAGEHASGEYNNDQEAVRELRKEIAWLRQFYDEISWTVKSGERVLGLDKLG